MAAITIIPLMADFSVRRAFTRVAISMPINGFLPYARLKPGDRGRYTRLEPGDFGLEARL
jgi:hypothetical protein